MTAVEWLVEQIINNKFVKAYEQIEAIDQAKEIEKQQIIQAFCCGGDGESGAEQYYNEIYKQDDKI